MLAVLTSVRSCDKPERLPKTPTLTYQREQKRSFHKLTPERKKKRERTGI